MGAAVATFQVGKLRHGATAAGQAPWSRTSPESWLRPCTGYYFWHRAPRRVCSEMGKAWRGVRELLGTGREGLGRQEGAASCPLEPRGCAVRKAGRGERSRGLGVSLAHSLPRRQIPFSSNLPLWEERRGFPEGCPWAAAGPVPALCGRCRAKPALGAGRGCSGSSRVAGAVLEGPSSTVPCLGLGVAGGGRAHLPLSDEGSLRSWPCGCWWDGIWGVCRLQCAGPGICWGKWGNGASGLPFPHAGRLENG